MTLQDLIAKLRIYASDAELIFTANGENIRGGYHLTEFKLAHISSIDCGARTASWTEASMQLLDGNGGDIMTIGKFLGIAGKSVEVLDELGEVDLSIEFAPGNTGMTVHVPSEPEFRDGRVFVNLEGKSAVCKPKLDYEKAMTAGLVRAQGSCCAPSQTSCC